MVQSAFSFPVDQTYKTEDFLSLAENVEVKNLLEKFFAQKDFSNAKFSSLILEGEEACGKTHLLNIFARKNSAKFLDKAEISQLNLIKFFTKNEFYIFDDADEIADDELLLHLVNSAAEANAFLIISLKDLSTFRLKDLLSRLKNIFITKIKSLEQSSIKELIVNGLSRRQIRFSNAMIDFIADNVARNYAAVFEVLNKVEELCHQQKGDVTLKDLKSLF
jgi:chromosomal replication initiation ATPase DnaA